MAVRGIFARVVAIAAIAAVLIGVSATSVQAATVQDEVVSITNAHRANAGVTPLRRDATLDNAAQQWANTLASTGNFVHSTNEWREARIPAGWDTHGENIAWGYTSASAVMAGWMGSAGHKANILRSTFTRIGIGYNSAGNYWVQIFAGYPADRLPQLTAAPTPKVVGVPRAGQTLTASAGSWTPSPVTLSYQWRANGVAIPGATASTFTIPVLQVGKTISVSVTGAKSGYASAVRTSLPTATA